MYWWLIKLLKKKVRRTQSANQAATPAPAMLSEAELERYSRHIILKEIGGAGQKKLKEAKVLVVGVGGLGAPALQYLAAAGCGTIGLIDEDVVEHSNLQRQVIHMDKHLGMPKVFSAQTLLQEQNPFISLRPYHRRFDHTCAPLIEEYDLILDCSDNSQTRYLLNQLCFDYQKPLIGAALSSWEGQISCFHLEENAPCYECIFPKAIQTGSSQAGEEFSCSQIGIASPITGVLGSMMALEAVKIIVGVGAPLSSQMLIYNGLHGTVLQVKTKKDAACSSCAAL